MSGSAAPRVFINYRRQDSAGHAGRLHDALASHLLQAEVFMDVSGMEPGVEFDTAISDAIGSCDVVLALIGPQWTTLRAANGERRLDEPGDYVVTEIALALERRVRLIPVLIDGARMPAASDLPDRIKSLAGRNAFSLDTVSWNRDLGELINGLARIEYPRGIPARSQSLEHGRTGYLPPRKGSGHIRGVARRVEIRHELGTLAFRLDHDDDSGRRLNPVAVEMRNYRSGQIEDGEEVEVDGEWLDGTFEANKVLNLATGAQMLKQPRWPLAIFFGFVLLVILAILFGLAALAWEALRNHGTIGHLPAITKLTVD